jgi:hypothetical protein
LRHGRAEGQGREIQDCDRAQSRNTVEAELHWLAFLKTLLNVRRMA